MEDVEDRAEQVRITREEAPRGDKERITIERTRRVRHVVEQPKGRIGSGQGGLERVARGMIGSQESSRLPETQEEEEEEEEEEHPRGKGKGKGKGKGGRHIPISATATTTTKTPPATPKTPPATPKKARIGASAKKGHAAAWRASKTARRAKRKKRLVAGGDETTESFGIYIHRVLKQVHPDMSVSKRCVSVLDSMVTDLFGRLAGESKALTLKTAKATMDSRTVQTAVKLVLPVRVVVACMVRRWGMDRLCTFTHPHQPTIPTRGSWQSTQYRRAHRPSSASASRDRKAGRHRKEKGGLERERERLAGESEQRQSASWNKKT